MVVLGLSHVDPEGTISFLYFKSINGVAAIPHYVGVAITTELPLCLATFFHVLTKII